MSSLLNQKACRKFILEIAKSRQTKFTRVSKDYMLALETQVRMNISKTVLSHPSVGKTITEFNYH